MSRVPAVLRRKIAAETLELRARITKLEQSAKPEPSREDPPLFHLGFAASQQSYALPRQREWGEVER